MVTIGTPKSATATKVLLCGSGELGKEFVIELQRYGVEVIALDKYADAPAMQVAHRSYVVSMLDGDALREIVEKEKPDYIVPEVEAIATQTLMELEKEGFDVERGTCNIETAFAASYGHGRPYIGILAEYDALSGLSQEGGLIERKEKNAGGNGHGCGHNLLGAGAFAADW